MIDFRTQFVINMGFDIRIQSKRYGLCQERNHYCDENTGTEGSHAMAKENQYVMVRYKSYRQTPMVIAWSMITLLHAGGGMDGVRLS